MTFKARKRNLVLTNRFHIEHEDLEFHVFRVSNFFASENIYTVFPSCGEYMNDASAQDEQKNLYLIVTFQANMGQLLDATEEELNAEREAFEKALRVKPTDGQQKESITSPSVKDDGASALIGYMPESAIWKDESRESFFRFMEAIQKTLAARLPQGERVFMDWPDPATGIPMCTARGCSSFTDSDVIEHFFNFNTVLVAGAKGSCRMVEHPRLGLNVYPSCGVVALPAKQEDAFLETLVSVSRTDE
ncbi:hypothetical protein STCU_04309 [Strigomonas culicis]|uniref:Uncharacterized protein n=1 Tax=Strigomonas culicis TaxID=28005 RepID=S9ULZ2_9TRYP|nr:hypothetical protein STCU_04309 [Strigomonas culicis]|eukprot:EPY29953.1 hypothetical protein STCU_04309 [Strigomonas culicis]